MQALDCLVGCNASSGGRPTPRLVVLQTCAPHFQQPGPGHLNATKFGIDAAR
mgnify:FL=1|tara:strand:- start:453 stop:608 length:156 start_codon:yes stop_codon:yes gene_type:complete